MMSTVIHDQSALDCLGFVVFSNARVVGQSDKLVLCSSRTSVLIRFSDLQNVNTSQVSMTIQYPCIARRTSPACHVPDVSFLRIL